MSGLFGGLRKWYTKHTDAVLRSRGIRLDDYLPPDRDVLAALRLMPIEQLQARQRRMLRTVDLNLKHVELSPQAQAVQKPFESYGLFELAKDLQKRRIERETYH